MLHIPIEQVITRIKEETGLSENEIQEQIKKKLKNLEGLVSEEGAAYIIASELGVQLFKNIGAGQKKIKDIIAGMQNIDLTGKVVRTFPPVTFVKNNQENQVGSFLIGDESGTIRIVVWDKQRVEWIKENKIAPGVIVKIQNANARQSNFGGPEVHLALRSSLILNPEGVNINLADESSETTKIKDVKPEQDCSLLATVVQVFNPFFYAVCPDCRKKVSEEDEKVICKEHGEVEPEPAMVLSLVLDDGTETIRCVAFRRTAEMLAGIRTTEAKQLSEDDNQLLSEKIEANLLGKTIEVQARVRENKQFERTEAIINRAILNPNPKILAERLMKNSKAD